LRSLAFSISVRQPGQVTRSGEIDGAAQPDVGARRDLKIQIATKYRRSNVQAFDLLSFLSFLPEPVQEYRQDLWWTFDMDEEPAGCIPNRSY
jgi:hypothetical protein